MVEISARDRRAHDRLQSASEFQETTWAYPADGVWKSIFRKRYAGTIVDVSPGGLNLLTNDPVDRDRYIEIEVCFRDFEPFTVEGRVRRCIVEDTAVIDGHEVHYYSVGVMLEGAGQDVQENMKKIVAMIEARGGV